jgi:hypothetical protein
MNNLQNHLRASLENSLQSGKVKAGQYLILLKTEFGYRIELITPAMGHYHYGYYLWESATYREAVEAFNQKLMSLL